MISKVFDIFFTIFFAMEAAVKIISYGFIMEHNSYLRESWSVLDFSIVILSLINVSSDEIDFGVFKIFRLLRILRPLRFISHNKNLKIMVTALIESVNGIISAVVVVLLIWYLKIILIF